MLWGVFVKPSMAANEGLRRCDGAGVRTSWRPTIRSRLLGVVCQEEQGPLHRVTERSWSEDELCFGELPFAPPFPFSSCWLLD